MKKTKRHLLLVVVVLVLLAIPSAVAFAKELGALTIAGPGITGELTLYHPKHMMNLEQSGFFDQASFTKPPENLNLDAGYSITAHLNLDGKTVPFIQMVYYPMQEGQPGYVHYTGRLEGDALQTVDQWNVLSSSADTAFRDLMIANEITLQPAVLVPVVKVEQPAAAVVEPLTAPVSTPMPVQTPYIILALAAGVMLLVGAGLVIRRRSIGHTAS